MKRANKTLSHRGNRDSVWHFAVGLALATGWAYSTSFGGVFVYDDVPAIVNNASIRAFWPPSNWFAAPIGSITGRPLLNFTLAINYAISGLEPWSYHAVNLAIHFLAALALFGVVRVTLKSDRLRGRFGQAATPIGFAAALLWVVHPLNTEAVTYVIQRGESLAGLFLFLTLYCSIRGWLWRAVVTCALGMASKETMIAAPAIVVLWDLVFRPGGARRRSMYGGLTATLLVLLLPMIDETEGRAALARVLGLRPAAPGDTWTSWSYLWTQAGVILHYVRLAFVPWPLVFDYYDWTHAWSPADVVPQAIVLTTLAGATVFAVIKRHPLGFAAGCFFLALAPTSSLLPIPTEIADEHRMYVPLASLIATAVVGACVVVRSRRGSEVAIAAGVLAVGLGLITRSRNLDYRSAEALWGDTVAKRPANARARINLGIEFMKGGRYAEAEAQMRAALPLQMDPPTLAQVHLQLGAASAAGGRPDEGIDSVRRALAIDPSIKEADRILGQAYTDLGNEASATQCFLRALEREPDDPSLLNSIAWLLATARDPVVRDGARAAGLGERAVRVTMGQDHSVYQTLAAAYAEQGRVTDALAAIDRAIALTRASGDTRTADLYQRQRAFYASGGRVAGAR